MKKKLLVLFLLFCLVIGNVFSQFDIWDLGRQLLDSAIDTYLPNNSPWSDAARNIITGTWDGLAQYNRVINNWTYYSDDRIQQGLANNNLTQDIKNSQYARIYIIFNRILESEHLANYRQRNWELYLDYSNIINAYACDGGNNTNYIIFNSGLINFANNDDEIAIVMGHEIAHLVYNHARQRLASDIVRNEIIKAISSSIQSNNNQISDKEMFNKIMGVGGALALLKFSRVNEEEADREGAKYAASVGYNTDAGYNYWTRLASIDNTRRSEVFLSTHPYSPDRANSFISGNYRARYYKDFNGYTRQNNNLATIYNDRGIEHYKKNNFQMAVADFSQASRLSPNNSVIQNNLANAQAQRNAASFIPPSNHTSLLQNQWISGNISSTNSVVWYSFSASSGITYNIWIDDYDLQDTSTTADVVIMAFYSDGTQIWSSEQDIDNKYISFTANKSSVIYIRVKALVNTSNLGTFSIAYNSR